MSFLWLVAPGLCAAGLVLGAGAGTRTRLWAVTGPQLTGLARTARSPALSGRSRRAALASVEVDVPAALALELRAGRELGSALVAVASEAGLTGALATRLRHAAAVLAAGGDVGEALSPARPPVPDPVAAALRVTAACCAAAVTSGMPLAELLETAARVARASTALRGVARAELAGARSSAIVLACLPLAGVGMGQLLGARPFDVLLGTVWGAGCLLSAAALTAAGLTWSRGITAGLRRALA